MFTLTTDPVADDIAVSAMSADDVVEAGREAIRRARQAEVCAVLLAYRIGAAVFDDMTTDTSWTREVGRSVRDLPDKAAVGEVSVQLGISRSTATAWLELGSALQDLPAVRLALLRGEYTLARGRVIATTLLLLDAQLRPQAEQLALELASRPSADRVLRDQLEELVIFVDPDAAVAAREDFADRNQDVRIRDDACGHASIDATVTAEHGVHLRRRLALLIAARVCPDDPRTLGQQRVAALAELHGVPQARLQCACGSSSCPKQPDRNHDDVAPEPEDPDVPDPDASTDLIVVTDPTGVAVPRLRGHGTIDREHAEQLVTEGVVQRLLLPPDLLPGQTATGPVVPVDPTGHGGHRKPPRGALTYRPSTAVRAAVLARDRTCRYPYCGRPADECQLDHLVPFNHRDPQAGGWSVPANLILLCTGDHHRKHLGLWIPTMHTDHTVAWRNPRTGEVITTYPQ